MGLLHNKVDKMIRLMVETSENQKKMNKVLQDLLKTGTANLVTSNNSSSSGPAEEGESERKRRRRDRSKERDESVADRKDRDR